MTNSNNNNAAALSSGSTNALSAAEAALREKEWLSLPLSFFAGMPGMELVGPTEVKYEKRRYNIKDFSDRAWMYYLQAYKEHLERCNMMGAAGRSYAAQPMNHRDFEIGLDVWRNEQLVQVRNRLIEELKYDGVGDHSELKKFLKLLCGTVRDGDLGAILQTINVTKRKMLGLTTGWEMMPVMYGSDHGSGKSTALLSLLSPLEMFATSASALDITDERCRMMLSDNHVITLSEIAGADRVEQKEMKRIITEPYIAYRPMRSGKVVNIRINATLWGTSNHEIDEIIHDEQMRRFHQIDVSDSIDKDAIRKLDFKAIWKSVDEGREWGYFEEYKEPLLAARKKLESGEPFAMWLSDFEIEPGHDGAATVDQLYLSYANYMEQIGIKYPKTLASIGRMLNRKKFKSVRKVVEGRLSTVYYIKASGQITQIPKNHEKGVSNDVFSGL